tara:strand:+ start:2157 stop:2711 length:555 start_codon:yes stop_codon:yes gene_type:complete
MFRFKKDAINHVYMHASLAGVPVTGLTNASVTLYAGKSDGTSAAVSLSAGSMVVEADATNMKGHYLIKVPAAAFNVSGGTVLQFTGAAFDDYNLYGDTVSNTFDELISYVKDIRALNQANFEIEGSTYDGNGNLTAATIKGYAPGTSTNFTTDTPLVQLAVTATYDASGNMTRMEVAEETPVAG